MFEIINTSIEKDIKDNYVAIGSYINKQGESIHSVLIICHNKKINQFHFDSKKILFEEIKGINCFHKITDVIDPILLPSFIIMCKRILKKANPRYGYFYSGEYYNQNGIHFSEKEISETMTCSGFCINILKGFLGKDYLKYNDWVSTSFPTEDYIEKYAKYFNLDKNKISESHRRISPIELLCSAYFCNLPIRKSQINNKLEETSEYLINCSENFR